MLVQAAEVTAQLDEMERPVSDRHRQPQGWRNPQRHSTEAAEAQTGRTKKMRLLLPLLLPLALLALPLSAAAQPVRVTLVNGTTQVGASVDLVTLYRLGQGMEPVDSVENPAEQVTLEGAGPGFG